eukprot:5519809-Amphidinium_carterae.3
MSWEGNRHMSGYKLHHNIATNHKALSNAITKRCLHDCNLDPRQLSSHSPSINHLLHYTTWQLDRYLRHSDGKTSYERKWKQPYNFGEKVYVDKQMAPNMRLYQRNQHQKHEAIWIGRDTTTGQHITLTVRVLHQLRPRTVMRLPKEQQIDKDLLLRVTSLTDTRNTNKTDKDMEPILEVPEPLLELRSPTQPALRQRPGTIVQDWHNKLQNHRHWKNSQVNPNSQSGFNRRKKPTYVQHQNIIDKYNHHRDSIRRYGHPTRNNNRNTRTDTTSPEPEQPQPKSENRRRLTTKTTPSQSALQATIDSGILHLTTNEDEEEKTSADDRQHGMTTIMSMRSRP